MRSVVLDSPAILPSWVRASASRLAPQVHHYVFISTLSVYADLSRPGVDETAPTTDRQWALRAGLSLEREAQVLAAWHARA